jgi:hypothetical protein
VEYRYSALSVLAAYLPVLLALVVIAVVLIWDAIGAVPAVLMVLSLLLEMVFTHHCVEDARAYWSFQRFFMGSIAVWAAM